MGVEEDHEEMRLIDSGVGTMSIIVHDKKPYLQVQEEEIHENQEQEESQDDNKDFCIAEGLNILEALSVIYGIPLESNSYLWNREDPIALCQKCAELVTILYSTFQEFNLHAAENSYVSKGIKQFMNRINYLQMNCGSTQNEQQFMESLITKDNNNEGQTETPAPAPKRRGRKPGVKKSTATAPTTDSDVNHQQIITTIEIQHEAEEILPQKSSTNPIKLENMEGGLDDMDYGGELISADLDSDHSDSLSEFEADIKGKCYCCCNLLT